MYFDKHFLKDLDKYLSYIENSFLLIMYTIFFSFSFFRGRVWCILGWL